jgi:hypothetical protein
MERRLFEVKSPEDWPIRTPFPALIAKLNSVSEGENKCSISSLERICVPDDGRLFPYRIGEELPTIRELIGSVNPAALQGIDVDR